MAREALADHRLDEFAQHEIARLEELRVEAVEERLWPTWHVRDSDLVGELARWSPSTRSASACARS